MSAVLETEPRAVATQVATVVERIRELETRADVAEAEAVRCKYEAARLIAEELERRQGGARPLGKEIGKSHTHVLRMEKVHKKHGGKPHVKSLSEWDKLYKGDGPQAVTFLKPLGHVKIRTAGGLLAEAALVIRQHRTPQTARKFASQLIDAIGEDAVREVLRWREQKRKAESRKRRSP